MKFQTILAGVALACLLSGCSQQAQEQVKDTTQAVAGDVKEGAKEAVDATKEAAAAGEVTASVKTALMASDKIDSSGINVDTVDKTVFLKGTVPTDAEKTLAEEIAINMLAEGLAVRNELIVGPAGSATPMASGTPTGDVTVTPEPVSVITPAPDGEDHTGHDHD